MKMKEFLDDVRKYGTRINRWDSYDAGIEQVDETDSVFLYEYVEDNTKYKVIIIMKDGEYVDYFKKVIE